MSSKEKLIDRFKRLPTDFTWDELVQLLGIFGFAADNKGKTSGSRIIFKKDAEKIDLHKPHPSKIIKEYKMKEILNYLIDKKFIKMED